jgi:hypothetical protein
MNRCALFVVPRDVLALVANFVLPENEQNKRIFHYNFDWRKFMSTSKQHLQEWKRSSQLVALTNTYSEKFRISLVFRDTVSRIIISPLEQLELKFNSDFSWISLADLGSVRKLEIHKGMLEDYPRQIGELILVDCRFWKLQDIPLKRCPTIPKLQIDFGDLIPSSLDIASDVPISLLQSASEISFDSIAIENCYHRFSHLDSLSISNDGSLRDVSCFTTIQRLTFDNCQGIRDVSSLGNVYHLKLSSCENISDVSALGNVHTLYLNQCPLVTDVSALTNVYELHLEGFTGDQLIGLENVVKLFLSNSLKITDLSPLRKVQILNLVNCKQISRFQPLVEYGQIREMSIGGEMPAKTFPIKSGGRIFKGLKKLELEYVCFDEWGKGCSEFILSWNELANIREYVFRGYNFTSYPKTPFSAVH